MIDDQIQTELQRRMARESEIAATLDPSLPFLTAIIMAGDLRQAEDSLARLRSGEVDLTRAMVLTGSYGRMSLLVSALDEGLITLDAALDALPTWWPSSDPDDTDPRLIDLWMRAFARNEGPVTDEGYSLPPRAYLTIWRGQRRGDPLGCAWSLARNVAERFASGASYRTPIDDPVLIEMKVPRGVILAYLTGRGEEEVIIDPTRVAATG